MSRVTIDDLVADCTTPGLDNNKYDKEACKIEIVPRKIVEKIIERCERSANFHNQEALFTDDYVRGRRWAFDDIHMYAASLLREFEDPVLISTESSKFLIDDNTESV